MSLKVLQLSDVHLDSQFRSPKLRFTEDKRKQRRAEIRQSLENAFFAAQERNVELVLIPGDLWDSEVVDASTVVFLGDLFRRFPIPVFISPGNHDYFSSNSPYDPAYLDKLGLRRWPESVHVFGRAEFTSVPVPGRADASVTGQCFRQNVRTDQRLLISGGISKPATPISVLMFHGSRIGYEAGKDFITAPFADGELLNLEFSYAALGHYHSFSTIEDPYKMIRGSYSGSLIGLGLGETGRHGAQILEITPTGVPQDGIERLILDARQVFSISMDITGLESSEQITNRILSEFERQAVGKQDIVYLQVQGQIAHGLELDFSDRPFEKCCWHLSLDINVSPDYDLTQLSQGDSVEARFIREMQQHIDAGADEVYRDALYYGLDALKHKNLLNRGAHS